MNGRLCFCWTLLAVGITWAPVEGGERLDPFFIPRPDFYGQPTSAPVEEEDRSSPNLVLQIGIDFKNVFTTKDNLVIVSVGLGAAWGASHFDQRVATSRLNSELHEIDGLNAGGSLDQAFEIGEIAGAGHVQAAIAVTTFGLGKLFSTPGVEDLGRDLVRAQVVAGVITFGIKVAAGRERPDGSSTTSFPSGHTSASFATATVLQRRYGWGVGIPAYAFAGYVATSRLNEGRHYLSDVIFGAALGIISGRTVTLSVAKERFALAPMFVPGGAGVQLTWLGQAHRSVDHVFSQTVR